MHLATEGAVLGQITCLLDWCACVDASESPEVKPDQRKTCTQQCKQHAVGTHTRTLPKSFPNMGIARIQVLLPQTGGQQCLPQVPAAGTLPPGVLGPDSAEDQVPASAAGSPCRSQSPAASLALSESYCKLLMTAAEMASFHAVQPELSTAGWRVCN